MDAERTASERDLAKTLDERAQVAAGVSAGVLALFERVSQHRKGLAMSEARDGLCTQCHVRLRPQVYNELRHNQSVMQCESCSRILFFVPPAVPTPVPGNNPRPPSQEVSSAVIRAYIDGGARGNPGPAGYGVRIEDLDGNLIQEFYGPLGIATNNVAEYNGLLAALKWAVDNGQRDVHIRADSELLVKQMRGEYKIKNPGLQPLATRARLLMMELGKVTFEHVRRELNQEADRLSNLGMDEAEKS